MKKTPITGKAEDSYSLQLSSSVVLHPETGVVRPLAVFFVIPFYEWIHRERVREEQIYHHTDCECASPLITPQRISVYGVLPGEEVRFRHGTVKGEHVGYLDEVRSNSFLALSHRQSTLQQ
jgi:hypothetical protein